MYADSISFKDLVLAMEASAHCFRDQSLELRSLWDHGPSISSGMAGPREVGSQPVQWYKGGIRRVSWHFPFEGAMERAAGTAEARCHRLLLGGWQTITY